jgi:hypothetical protein
MLERDDTITIPGFIANAHARRDPIDKNRFSEAQNLKLLIESQND